MSNEEAIAKLESLLAWAAAEFDFDEIAEAIQLATEALRKQTAMNQCDMVMSAVAHCPVCNNVITYSSEEQFCFKCGQKIMWVEYDYDD